MFYICCLSLLYLYGWAHMDILNKNLSINSANTSFLFFLDLILNEIKILRLKGGRKLGCSLKRNLRAFFVVGGASVER